MQHPYHITVLGCLKKENEAQKPHPWGISWLLVASLNATPLSHYGARLFEERKKNEQF